MSCHFPFESLYLLPDGFSTCCQSWVNPQAWVIDREHKLGAWQAWNHPNFQELRRRVLFGDWSQCVTCPRVPNNLVPETIADDVQPVMQRGPTRIIITNDLVCNLHCWSCRTAPIGRRRQSEARRERSMIEILDTFRPWITCVRLLQSGEVFASPMHIKWLIHLNPREWRPEFKIELTTNGTLMADKWNTIKNAHPMIGSIAISVDAGTKQTYEKVRRGGKWSDVKQGMELAAQLKRDDRIDTFRLLFCVQSDNFRDIPAYIRMGKALGANSIGLMQLRPWWQSDSQYSAACVANPKNPDHEEYLRILECEELRWPEVEASQLIGAAKQLIPLAYFGQKES